MNGIFISHSTKNSALVERIVELLQSGMGIERSKIFCTSLNGTLPTGKNFIEIIKDKVQNQQMVMAIITPEYLQSQFCMMELGAAWIKSEYLCPILADGTVYSDLANSPLAGIQMRRADYEDDWYAIYDELIEQQMIPINTAQFRKKLQNFIKSIPSGPTKNTLLSTPDLNGYYDVSIEKERAVPSPFQCYKIKGKLSIAGAEEFIESESHWIFYKTGVFNTLKAGDQVRLKIAKTERRYFNDIGFARNIYPEEMYVLESNHL